MKLKWLFIICCNFFAGLCSAQSQPKLVIGITVDQMRWDYLYRFADKYGSGGFKRLLREGFSYENAMIPYTPTVTAAGHACLFTGSVPALNGMVGNYWFDRDSNRVIYCTEDNYVETLGSFSRLGKESPRNLLAGTIGDELRAASHMRSRVFGIALKDRGSIMPAGRGANAAYWFDDSTGNWISSTWYMRALPQWVNAYNARKVADSLIRAGWPLEIKDSDTLYSRKLAYDTGRGRHAYTTRNGRFYSPVRAMPGGNFFSADFAKSLIRNESLGLGDATDMLCLSFSSPDFVIHEFGPQSKEAEDMYIKLDLEIESLLRFLDKEVGKKNYLLFLSADHAAPLSPGYLRDSLRLGGTISVSSLRRELNAAGLRKFGVDSLMRYYSEFQLYVNHAKADSARIPKKQVIDFFVQELMKRPEIIYAFDYSELAATTLPPDLKVRFANGYFPKRSADIQFLLRSQYSDGSSRGTDHGTPYPYDAHIPMLFFGTNIPNGRSHREVYMNDIAPTVCALLQIQMPGAATGKVLTEILP